MAIFKPVVAEVQHLVFKQIREVMRKGNKAPKVRPGPGQDGLLAAVLTRCRSSSS